MTSTTLLLDDANMASFPALVAARVQEIADVYGYESFTYHEVAGTIDDPGQDIEKQINLWIAGSDDCNHDIHLGGSACWICPDNHYIFFHPIDPALLPKEPDLSTWWVIKHEDSLQVYKIAVRPEHQVEQGFPDL